MSSPSGTVGERQRNHLLRLFLGISWQSSQPASRWPVVWSRARNGILVTGNGGVRTGGPGLVLTPTRTNKKREQMPLSLSWRWYVSPGSMSVSHVFLGGVVITSRTEPNKLALNCL
ncbi:hypothetical protein ILYODFUR_005985 [Ilyodon furcidens]|uniref:Uncharacterized protein n=1 Tax=Ilyodon furcidens TaxID=33524 RepID=A0ABV0UE71_9TELE